VSIANLALILSSLVPSRGDLEPNWSKQTKRGDLSGQNKISKSIRLAKNHSSLNDNYWYTNMSILKIEKSPLT
jgi:hypothetical protein